jgi:hypothetical protein
VGSVITDFFFDVCSNVLFVIVIQFSAIDYGVDVC